MNLFVFGSCFRTLAVILFQSFVHWFILLIFSSPSSLAFHACPQTTSLMVTGKFGCLHQVLFGTPELLCLKAWLFPVWGHRCVRASVHRGQNGRTCFGVCGPVSLTWAVDCAVDKDDTGVHSQQWPACSRRMFD